MPSAYTYPGVYVEEVPSGVRTITGVSTSDTAFIDFFGRGPMNRAVRVTGMEDFDRRFGGLHRDSEASYAINQFYLNGGQIAWVVRVAGGEPVTAQYRFAAGGSPAGGELVIEAASPGLWAKDHVQVAVDHQTRAGGSNLFNLAVRELDAGRRRVVASEVHRNVSMDPDERPLRQGRRGRRLRARSGSSSVGNGGPPAPTGPNVTASRRDRRRRRRAPSSRSATCRTTTARRQPVTDGTAPGCRRADRRAGRPEGDRAVRLQHPLPARRLAARRGRHGPRDRRGDEAVRRRARLPDRRSAQGDQHARRARPRGSSAHGDTRRHRNAAFYFPRVSIPDPLNEGRPRDVGPSGTIAGVYARTDANRGVWKAPAGADDGRLAGVTLPAQVTDLQNGQFNPLGINLLRTFPIYGNVIWGARTLDGADQQASEWKYVPVRRTALFIEESLSQGLKWVVFEPNDEPLWAQIRLNVGTFMHDRFRQGAFQGTTPREAYFVKCDSETTTQSDIDRGIVNILVGFAPLKPAEFVVIRIQQMAGQTEA